MINFNNIRAQATFITRHKERCTVLGIQPHSDLHAMPVFKVHFMTRAGAQYQALYYQNGVMFDCKYNDWDAVSLISHLEIPQSLPLFVEPSIKKRRV